MIDDSIISSLSRKTIQAIKPFTAFTKISKMLHKEIRYRGPNNNFITLFPTAKFVYKKKQKKIAEKLPTYVKENKQNTPKD